MKPQYLISSFEPIYCLSPSKIVWLLQRLLQQAKLSRCNQTKQLERVPFKFGSLVLNVELKHGCSVMARESCGRLPLGSDFESISISTAG
jgi:hypothetical protein